jgi:hypothetical protein
MKKREIIFNIPNKFSYTLIAFALIIGLAVGVYASGGTHTMGEITAPCTGILTWSGSSWSCISTPITCSGTNQVLHWSGSSWSCATVTVGFACNWNGWMPDCACLTFDAPGSNYCGWDAYNNPILPRETDQAYCSSGYVTDMRTVWCCNQVGGECMAF